MDGHSKKTLMIAENPPLFMYQPIYVEGILKNTPPIKDTFDSIYEISTNMIIDIDNNEFIKHFEESQK